MMSDRMARIMAGHTEVGGGVCGHSFDPWPCETGVVLAALREMTERAVAAEAALSVAEKNTVRHSTTGGAPCVVCRICDQFAFEPPIDHAPDCPFAALAATSGAAPASGDPCTTCGEPIKDAPTGSLCTRCHYEASFPGDGAFIPRGETADGGEG